MGDGGLMKSGKDVWMGLSSSSRLVKYALWIIEIFPNYPIPFDRPRIAFAHCFSPHSVTKIDVNIVCTLYRSKEKIRQRILARYCRQPLVYVLVRLQRYSLHHHWTVLVNNKHGSSSAFKMLSTAVIKESLADDFAEGMIITAMSLPLGKATPHNQRKDRD